MGIQQTSWVMILNILFINVFIEASRADESSQSDVFSVAAEEIRKLSDDSKLEAITLFIPLSLTSQGSYNFNRS